MTLIGYLGALLAFQLGSLPTADSRMPSFSLRLVSVASSFAKQNRSSFPVSGVRRRPLSGIEATPISRVQRVASVTSLPSVIADSRGAGRTYSSPASVETRAFQQLTEQIAFLLVKSGQFARRTPDVLPGNPRCRFALGVLTVKVDELMDFSKFLDRIAAPLQ